MTKTKIEWSEITWNPVTGCTKISEGCQNCYAEKMHKRLQAMGKTKYFYDFNEEVIYHGGDSYKTFGKKPRMIFVNSMSDTFHKDLKQNQIADIISYCAFNPQHTFQILTKRAERLTELDFYYPENIWLGVTVELAKYKERIEHLKATNAKVKFLSCEPLLGDLGELDLTGIHWVIVGGESGSNARPCHPDWVRNIQRQCQEQKVSFFFKQWGEWMPACEINEAFAVANFKTAEIGDDVVILNTQIKTVENQGFYKVGKKKAGCLLDGKEYKEYPVK